jgi:hypothetical protein
MIIVDVALSHLGSAGVTKHQMKAVHRTARESIYLNIDRSIVHHLNCPVRLVPCLNGPEQRITGCRFRSALIEMCPEPAIVAGGRELSIEENWMASLADF